jgi:imidazolonepropionase-like amidohydrolase
MLEAGVTSIRQLGDPRDAILDVKRRLDARELAGPRMFVAGPIFTAPGGHPAYGGRDPNPSGFGGLMTFQSDDPAAIRAEIARLASQGVDGIKAVLHGSVSEDGKRLLPTMSDATFEALVAEAKAHGLWIAVHVGPAHEAGQAARAGVTTVEHGIRSGNRVDESTLQALVDNGVMYVPTLGQEPDGHLAIPALYAGGVLLGVGTDVDDYHDELGRLAAAGVPPAEVLIAATRNGARALHRSAELGTLEHGKVADVVLARGTPWANIADARNVVAVVQGGYLVVDRR